MQQEVQNKITENLDEIRESPTFNPSARHCAWAEWRHPPTPRLRGQTAAAGAEAAEGTGADSLPEDRRSPGWDRPEDSLVAEGIRVAVRQDTPAVVVRTQAVSVHSQAVVVDSLGAAFVPGSILAGSRDLRAFAKRTKSINLEGDTVPGEDLPAVGTVHSPGAAAEEAPDSLAGILGEAAAGRSVEAVTAELAKGLLEEPAAVEWGASSVEHCPFPFYHHLK